MKKMKKIGYLLLFALAFSYIEASVVVYLRHLYYPDNITGPLFPISLQVTRVGIIELGRELATLVLLAALALATSSSLEELFAHFTFSFAAWNILYYAWLKLLIGWPASFKTWDVLFLLPTVWASPWWCPALVAAIMAFIALFILAGRRKLTWSFFSLYAAGSLLIFISFIWNAPLILKGGVPTSFPYLLYLAGLLVLSSSALRLQRRT